MIKHFRYDYNYKLLIITNILSLIFLLLTILSFEKNEEGKYIEKYIEVKSTKGNEGTPIDITVDEINFAKEHMDNYYLYRIIYSDSDKRYLKIVNGKDLLESYSFVPVAYKIYSK